LPLEKEKEWDIRDSIIYPQAFWQRLQQITGVKLSESVLRALDINPERLELTKTDILNMKVRVKHLDLVDFAEAQLLVIKAEESYQKKKNREQAIRLFQLADEKFSSAISSNPQSPVILEKWALCSFKESKLNKRREKGNIE